MRGFPGVPEVREEHRARHVLGKADPQSWRANGCPLLFDGLFAHKKAYDAVMDPEGFLKANP
jgi:hypothetical protein